MKKLSFLAILFFELLTIYSKSQGVWTQMADFGGGNRGQAIGFSLGAKGYIGTGYDDLNYHNDLWEYDINTNIWTQKANFSGLPREGAVAFSIGNFGYVGTGYDGTFLDDFWKYDPNTNSWIQIANFPGSKRRYATAFTIGSRGYVGTGQGSTGISYDDLWEYNPSTNLWLQKSNLTGGKRYEALSFSINGMGFIGSGKYNSPTTAIYINDFWEYNPVNDSWTQKANVPARTFKSVCFSIGNFGFISTGIADMTSFLSNDTWKYEPSINNWIQITSFGGQERSAAAGFSINGKGYLGTGGLSNGSTNDFWEFDPNAIGISENVFIYNVQISPNPSSDFISVTYESITKLPQFEILDMMGNVVAHLQGFQSRISTSKLPQGLYLLKVSDGDLHFAKRFIKQ